MDYICAQNSRQLGEIDICLNIYSSRMKNVKEGCRKMCYGNKKEYVMSSDWGES